MTGAELRQHAGRNATERACPHHMPIHELFEAQAAIVPERVALVAGDQRMSYRELNARANRLARWLRGLGTGREAAVGVLLDRSMDFVVAVLATLKAGAMYLPLDPQCPRPQLEFMVHQADVAVVVTRRGLAGLLSAADATQVFIDEIDTGLDRVSQENLGIPVDPRNLAYVMFTSGSTGKPKAVMICHHSVVRLVKNVDYLRLDSAEVLAQISSVTFDVCTFEIWGALLNGARLVIGPSRAPSLEELTRLLCDHEVTTVFFTAALFHLLVEYKLDDLRGLRQLLTGGDVVSAARVREAARRLPGGCQVIDCYGPTECTTFSSCFPVPAGWGQARSVPIGKPIGNATMRVLDHRMQPLPVGHTGELYIGGDGLARGYLGDPCLTAERFVPVPSGRPGERFYRTGDLARWLPDGNLEFMGRVDRQVKVRGFRVEPGEIEEILRAHPAVRDAVVVPHGVTAEERALVAYPVLEPSFAAEAAKTVRALRSWLEERLPGHLVPDLWQPVDALPLTTNGKIDRHALPPPEGRLAAQVGESEADGPDGAAELHEQVIAAIWAQVFGLAQVGINEDFFELGGHSLLAARIVAQLHDAFDIEVPLSAIFDHPTVAGQAELIRTSTPIADPGD